ncbi:BBSome complex assembly protein BBS10 [Cynoglossus semilaevis]|nr:Bardet-Biedl syndrome 10 protein [Cynoglossus semilaevis]XP_024911716.1 Bardet-Biedl syndrome 10 protein [Cynoglossus semilaevis]XP_024911717.1 Bardet-Biedl syndrome 10 protein [Cynoglossus semilaevis]
MLQVDQPHFQHVLQIVSALEAVVLRSFGPNGGQVLFTKDTGEAIVTRSGTRILTALRLKHPLARMVVDCVWKHSRATGDGSKNFILLLASLLRMFQTALQTTTAWRLAYELREFGMMKLDEIICLGVLPYGFCAKLENDPLDTHYLCVKKLLTPFFQTRLGQTHCDMISHLTCEFLMRSRVANNHPSSGLHFVYTNFPALHTTVSGVPVTCSRLIEGQVIHSDFAVHFPQTDKQPVKAVVFTQHVQPKLLGEGDILTVGFEDQAFKKKSIVEFTAWSEKSLQLVFASLQSFGVSVLLSAVKQSAAFLALAAQAEMCVVECVSEDELSLFARLSRTAPVLDCCAIEAVNVATLTFCCPLTLGVQRYVHVAFPHSEQDVVVNLSSLVICGSGKEQTDQYASAFQDSIRMLLTTYEPRGTTTLSDERTCLLTDEKTESASSSAPDLQQHVLDSCCVVPAGGAFEILLSRALLQHGDKYPVSRLLSDALLSVSRHICTQTSGRFSPAQAKVLTQCDGFSSKAVMSGSSLESVSCKHILLQSVLWCATSLLRVDKILYTHVVLNTDSQKSAGDSWDDTG